MLGSPHPRIRRQRWHVIRRSVSGRPLPRAIGCELAQPENYPNVRIVHQSAPSPTVQAARLAGEGGGEAVGLAARLDDVAAEGEHAMDAAATEITWVAGPVVTFAVAGWAGTGSALVVAAAILTLSVASFASCAASRRCWRPVSVVTARPGTLSSVNLRVLTAALVGVGVVFGATEVAVTALSTSLGAPGAAGPLLGLWGLGSLCGGVVVARFTGGGAQSGRGLAALLVVLGAGHAALAAAGSHWLVLGVLITAAGSMIAPILGSAYGMVDRIAPTGTRTEAFAWLATATAVGSAIGAALAGVLVDAQGAAAGFLLAATAATLAAALAGTRLQLNTQTAPPAGGTKPASQTSAP